MGPLCDGIVATVAGSGSAISHPIHGLRCSVDRVVHFEFVCGLGTDVEFMYPLEAEGQSSGEAKGG